MKADILVLKVGSGVIDDEATGEKKPWAKLYGISDRFTSTTMFKGFEENHFNIVDPETLQPCQATADEIGRKLESMKLKAPTKLTFDMCMTTVSKRQVLAVTGLSK